MAATKHRIMRLADEHWTKLAEIFREVVPADRIPAHANPESEWQISEGLRMIANGEISLRIKPPPRRA